MAEIPSEPSVCDSCENSYKHSQYKCVECDYRMCDDCYGERLIRNPGHPILPTATANQRSLPASTAIPRTCPANDPTIDQAKRRCCSTCFNYTPDFIQAGERWYSRTQLTLSAFRTSGADGCQLCSIVYRGIKQGIPDALECDTLVRLVLRSGVLKAIVNIDGRLPPMGFNFRTMSGHRSTWSTLGSAEILSSSLRDARCFDEMKRWLDVCEKSHHHPRCRQAAESTLPRRLVTVGGNSRSPELKLQEFNGSTGRYIALSHCWGGFAACQTTTANITARIAGIDYDSLPMTFKDAVDCALRLDIPYIWIDSLCIIQNDSTDWERESAKMCDIYSDAFLVLAAASADTDTSGFLTEPQPIYRGVGLESDAGSGVFDMVINATIPHSGDINHPAPLSPVNLGPLSKRAWTLQETLLARRCVGFNPYEVAWECQTTIKCECGKTSGPVTEGGTLQRRLSNGPLWIYGKTRGLVPIGRRRAAPPRPLNCLDGSPAVYMEWRELILPNYVKRALTIPGDKLPALSGIAGLIASSSRDKYLAGIWLKDISFGLAWRVSKPWNESTKPAPATPLGPSFSWVSVDNEITYGLPPPKHDDGTATYGSVEVTVLDYDILLATKAPYGSVRSGWIKVSALSYTLRLRQDSSTNHSVWIDASAHQPHKLKFFPDTMLCGAETKGYKDECVLIQRATPNQGGEQPFDTLVTAVLLLDIPLADSHRLHHKDGSPEFFRAHEVALMVLSATPTAKGRFQRIGLAIAIFEPTVAPQWIQNAELREFVIE